MIFVRSMETPIEMFHMEHRQYPTSLEDLLTPPSYVDQAKGNWPYIKPSALGTDPWGILNNGKKRTFSNITLFQLSF